MKLCSLYEWSLKIKSIVFKVEEGDLLKFLEQREETAEPRLGFCSFYKVPSELLLGAQELPVGLWMDKQAGSPTFPSYTALSFTRVALLASPLHI